MPDVVPRTKKESINTLNAFFLYDAFKIKF